MPQGNGGHYSSWFRSPNRKTMTITYKTLFESRVKMAPPTDTQTYSYRLNNSLQKKSRNQLNDSYMSGKREETHRELCRKGDHKLTINPPLVRCLVTSRFFLQNKEFGSYI